MAHSSQYYRGQINLVNELIVQVDLIISTVTTFSSSYKEQIDKVNKDGMMIEVIEKLQNTGYPNYNHCVTNSVSELNKLKVTLNKMIQELQTALTAAEKLERDLNT